MFKLSLVRLIYWLKGRIENPIELFRALGIRTNESILEIGCAIGYHTIILANIVIQGKIIAVDIWEEGLEFLEKRIKDFPNIEIQKVCGDSIDVPSSSIYKIICFDTLHEIPNHDRAIKKWITVLKEGGKFIFRDPEVGPTQIEEISNNKLIITGIIDNIYVFVCKK